MKYKVILRHNDNANSLPLLPTCRHLSSSQKKIQISSYVYETKQKTSRNLETSTILYPVSCISACIFNCVSLTVLLCICVSLYLGILVSARGRVKYLLAVYYPDNDYIDTHRHRPCASWRISYLESHTERNRAHTEQKNHTIPMKMLQIMDGFDFISHSSFLYSFLKLMVWLKRTWNNIYL